MSVSEHWLPRVGERWKYDPNRGGPRDPIIFRIVALDPLSQQVQFEYEEDHKGECTCDIYYLHLNRWVDMVSVGDLSLVGDGLERAMGKVK